MRKFINNFVIEDDTDLNMFYAEYDHYVNLVKQGDSELLDFIEGSAPKYQYALSEFMEEALKQLKSVMNESVMMESHGRTLTLYRTICKEHNHHPVV